LSAQDCIDEIVAWRDQRKVARRDQFCPSSDRSGWLVRSFTPSGGLQTATDRTSRQESRKSWSWLTDAPTTYPQKSDVVLTAIGYISDPHRIFGGAWRRARAMRLQQRRAHAHFLFALLYGDDPRR
jgi:hypothetical protein